MAERDIYHEDDEAAVDGASPASIVGGMPPVDIGDRPPDEPPMDALGMENVQQLPGEASPDIDIKLPSEQPDDA
ncbi:MAG TPA: hypothetical protein VFR15_08230 [Chloroflexia bacterium]|nr:hypothetical protein [Chloroflexia bacterium]